MTVQRFYQSTLWLPPAVPATVLAGWLILGGATSRILQNAATVLIGSLIIGGIPYTVLAIWLSRRMRGRSEAEIRRLLLRAPVFMIVAFSPIASLAALISGQLVEVAVVAVGVTIAIFIVGYAYVGLVFLLRRLVDTGRCMQLTESRVQQ